MSTFCLLYILFNVCAVLTMTVPDTLKCQLENPAVVRFREYLQIDTSRSENLQKAVDFWKRQAEEFGLEFSVYEPAGKPICVLTWRGANSSLPSIMLNTHMDVVPAVKEDWAHPPYDAVVDANGNIYGRGAQDTKDIAIQYLEAVGKIKRDNITLQRTVHLTLMPDEEIGGFQGMKVFVKTPEFAALNIGFALDEGLVSPTNELYATNQDRLPWFMNFTVEGSGGHGSSMPDDLAIIKLQRLLNVLMDYRQPHVEAVKLLPYVEYGLHTTLNVNMLNGGTAPNTIPQRFHLVADLRLAPNENLTEISALVNSWMAHAGPNTTVEFLRQEKESPATPIDETNPYWVAMNDTIHQLGYKLVPVVCPATSDMIFARAAGVPAIGFAPRAYTTSRVHGVDEYLNLDIFLQGIDVYVALVKRLANVPG